MIEDVTRCSVAKTPSAKEFDTKMKTCGCQMAFRVTKAFKIRRQDIINITWAKKHGQDKGGETEMVQGVWNAVNSGNVSIVRQDEATPSTADDLVQGPNDTTYGPDPDNLLSASDCA